MASAPGFFVDLSDDYAVVEARGPDARSLLQGLLSNDLDKLSATRALWAALLTPQGKYLFDMIAFADGPTGVLMTVAADRADALSQRLNMYKLRADASIAVSAAIDGVFRVYGEDVVQRFGLALERGAARTCANGVRIAVDPRSAELGALVIGPNAEARAAIADQGLEPGDRSAYDALRISLAAPESGRDLIVDKTTLLEAGFAELDGVDFAKGCYVGQEVTARTRWRGLVKRRLAPLALIDGPPPAVGAAVMQEGRDVGRITSVAGAAALASMKVDALERARGGAPLEADGAALRPAAPPWLEEALDAATAKAATEKGSA